MYYQDINELLAKGIKVGSMPSDYAEAVTCANEYLISRKGKKPEWLNDFLESNRCKLIETICRATADIQGISSLQGYSEGYFNEIIQNANDLHCGDSIEISVSKNGNECTLACQYADQGFELSNIYAFLNREMSDKSDDEAQTGKFGVGIKSFFKFVDTLKIDSNVAFDFSISRTKDDISIKGKTFVNNEWNTGKTTLTISYNSDVVTSFNTVKLTKLIDYLCGSGRYDAEQFFLTGEDTELVFDARSLIFMFINAKSKRNISKLVFKGAAHQVTIVCSEETRIRDLKNEEESWKTGEIKLQLLVDGNVSYERKYIIFSHDSISSAFSVGCFSKEPNRMYSTYYLKADTQEQILPIGMLVDSKFANIHRNDVGDSEEKITQVYEKVRGYMKNLYGFMCSEEASYLSCAEDISDVFHNIIARYLLVEQSEYWETPLYDVYFQNAKLPKLQGEVPKSYVIMHKSKEAYDNSSFQEGDITRELKENYFDYIEKKDAYDLYELLTNPKCIGGVKTVYSMLLDLSLDIPNQNRESASKIVNFFESVKAYMVYAISGDRKDDLLVTDSEIDNWLITLKEQTGKYFNAQLFLKFVGRYELNDAIAYDGSIRHTNLSFKDYLFNGILATSNGVLAQYQNQYYDEKYYGLKEELLEKRYVDYGNQKKQYMVRCIRPCGRSITGWNGTYDYYEMSVPANALLPLSQPELLLERMATDPKFTGLWLGGSTLRLFETRAKSMWRRDYEFKSYTIDEQQIIDLSCLQNVRLKNFSDFISAIKHRAMLSEDLRNYIHISCKEEGISTRDIAEKVLPIITDVPEGEKSSFLLEEFSPSDVVIEGITENSNNEMPVENIEFIYKVTGYRVHLYRFISNTRRKILIYFGDKSCAVKVDASKKFREVASYTETDKNIYIFYDNIGSDVQQAVNSVLEMMNVSTKDLALLEGYIHNGNTTKTMSYMSRRRNLAKIKKKLILEWANLTDERLSKIDNTEILYRLLIARGSYDIFCPICAEISLELFDYGEDTKKKHSRQIILLENENPDTKREVPYVITIACSYCCQRLRNTLIKSEFDGKNLILITQISHGMHEKTKSKQVIELSPANIQLMKMFKID